MKRLYINRIIVVILFACFLPLFSYGEILSDTTYYRNGTIKEIADWKNGIIIGSRKLFDNRGGLVEEHTFLSGNSKGKLISYYKDTLIASIVPVEQKIVNGKYSIFILPEEMVVGYWEGTNIKSYDYTIADPLQLPNDNYVRYNNFYNDPLLYSTRNIAGLNAKVAYYNKNGNMIGEDVFVNGLASGISKTFYPNGQVKSEGHQLQERSRTFPVNKWIYYYEDGVIEKEMEYYNGSGSVKYMEAGKLINIGKYNYRNGAIHMLIRYPQPVDLYPRTDTLEVYYENAQIMKKYDPMDHISFLFSGSDEGYQFSGKYSEFYENGNPKVVGYIVKIPRYEPSAEDKNLDAYLLEKDNRRVGTWYFFDENGNMINIIEYKYITGEVGKVYSKEDIEKENAKYQLNKSGYNFDFVVKL